MNFSLNSLNISDNQGVALSESIELKQTVILEEEAVFGSQIFDSSHNLNQLIAAASPLFSLISRYRVKKGKLKVDKSALFNALKHEVMAFTNKARQANYRHNMVLAARYMLCAFLDEAINTTPWGKEQNWQENTLLKFFHNETDGGERFFVLIDEAYKDAPVYLDLLELAYLCLRLGFMGKYRTREDGVLSVNKICDLLYVAVQKQRGESDKGLFVGEIKPTAIQPKSTSMKFVWLSTSFSKFGMVVGGVVVCIALLVVYVVLKTKFNVELRGVEKSLGSVLLQS